MRKILNMYILENIKNMVKQYIRIKILEKWKNILEKW